MNTETLEDPLVINKIHNSRVTKYFSRNSIKPKVKTINARVSIPNLSHINFGDERSLNSRLTNNSLNISHIVKIPSIEKPRRISDLESIESQLYNSYNNSPRSSLKLLNLPLSPENYLRNKANSAMNAAFKFK